MIDETVNVGIWGKSIELEVVHKWWEALHDFEISAHLTDAIKRHLYKIKFENEAMDSAVPMR